MGKNLILSPVEDTGVILRTIQRSDCERLRIWKNANRRSFFYQEDITPAMQQDWYEGYIGREQDMMFIVEVQKNPAGCIGVRMLDQTADIYNVILGLPRLGKRGYMGIALRLICCYARTWTSQISAKVLRANPAVRWYEKNGFVIHNEHDTYVEMVVDWNRFQVIQFHSREE